MLNFDLDFTPAPSVPIAHKSGPVHLDVSIVGPINRQAFEVLQRDLATAPHAESLSIEVDSHGGDVIPAFDMYAILVNHPAKTKVAHLMTAQSAALIVSMAGNMRLAYPDTTILLHRCQIAPVTGSRWTADRHREAAGDSEWIDRQIVRLLAFRTGTAESVFEAAMANEHNSTLEWAQKHGVIQSIIGGEQ